MDEKYKHVDITGKIIGAAMKVHSILGNGFSELTYQRALKIEFEEGYIFFEREKEMDITYKGEKINTRRVDFLVEGKVLVELKAVSHLEEIHHAQILNYLRVFELEVGLLINFGSKSLEFKRFVR